MDAAYLLLLIPVGAIWLALHPLVIYPCRLSEWRYAFGSRHRDMRGNLLGAARKLDAVQRKKRKIQHAFARRVAETDSRTEDTVQALQQKRDSLRAPSRGERVAGLGKLELYKTRLVFLEKEPDGTEPPAEVHSMPLPGLKLETGALHGKYVLTATCRGDRRSVTFPDAQGEEVLHLVDAIRSAAHKEEIECREREDEALKVSAELRRIEADAHEQKEKLHNSRAERVAALKPEIERAEEAYELQCSEWEKETGRRPHPRWCRSSAWWWRW